MPAHGFPWLSKPNAYSAAPPIRDSRRQVIASFSISGPNFRLTEEQLEINIHEVLSTARKISENLDLVNNKSFKEVKLYVEI